MTCRSRYGLNVHCLAHIFQCLGIVGEMNEFYKQIFNEVNFDELHQWRFMITQVFERYEKAIQMFYFQIEWKNITELLLQTIARYQARLWKIITHQSVSSIPKCQTNLNLMQCT